MRTTSFVVALALAGCCCVPLSYSGEHRDRSKNTKDYTSQNTVSVTRRTLDAGRLAMNISDRAYIAEYDYYAQDTLGWYIAGSLWPYSPNKNYPDNPHGQPVAYDQGPWVIGKVNGVPAAAVTEWRGTFMPGPIIDGRPALHVRPQDAARYHPYKIDRKSSPQNVQDSLSWPADLGAPTDAQGRPQILGDQMVWCVYNGADSTTWPSPWKPRVANDTARPQFPRLPVEVHQSIYTHRASSRSDTSLVANVVFIEWTFINKGALPVDSCYLGLWSDMDNMGGFNHPGVDTSCGLGYCWNDVDNYHGESSARAAGYVLLYGPVLPDPSATALVRGQVKSGYRNLGLSSFFGHGEDGGPDAWCMPAPQHIKAAWNVARGFDKLGRPIIDSLTMKVTRFPLSGDPVTGTGWLGTKYQALEAGFMFFTGPFTFAPGDTQWMMSALVPADNGDNKGSITLLRNYANRLHGMTYDEMIAIGPAAYVDPQDDEDDTPELPTVAALNQNYPNPFNPVTTIRYELPEPSHVTLTVFNTLGQQVAKLIDGDIEAGFHDVQFDAGALATGAYFYRLQAGGFVETKRLMVLK
jgi:hypothetical protein